MRFVSKSTNLNVILRPSLPGNPMLGTPATPGLSVRFVDGIADIKEQEMIDLMTRHPGFQQDFIAVDEGERDPYAYSRGSSEPVHVMTDMRYGTPERRVVGGKPQLPPEVQKLVQEYAAEMVKELLANAAKASAAPAPVVEEAPQVVEETPEVESSPAATAKKTKISAPKEA